MIVDQSIYNGYTLQYILNRKGHDVVLRPQFPAKTIRPHVAQARPSLAQVRYIYQVQTLPSFHTQREVSTHPYTGSNHRSLTLCTHIPVAQDQK